MKAKQILAGTLAGVLAMGMLAGCGGTEKTDNSAAQETTEKKDESAEKVTIDMYQYKVEVVSALEKAIEQYEKENPNVTINLETIGAGGNYGENLKVKMQAAKKPDIFNVDGPQRVQDYEYLLEDLSDQPWVEYAAEGSLGSVSKDGKIYGMLFCLEGYGFVYNKRIFDKAGIDASKLTTYDAIESAVKDLDERIKAGEFQEDFPLLEAAFEYPAKEFWVPGQHTVNLPLIPELQDPITALNTKEIKMEYSDAFQKLIDLQTLYSSNGEDRSKLCAVDYATQVGGGLAIERVAMVQQGN